MDISFSGAGFIGCYYFGVVDCWNKYIPRDRVNRVAGASAGSLIAAYYLMDLPLGVCLKEIIAMTEDIRRRPLGVFDRTNQIVDVLPRILHKILPDDAHKRVGNRLHVCITRLKDMKKVIVNEFESKQDLIDALNCSCFIPVWSGNHVSTYKGVKYIDGGFSDNLPVFDEYTIRVCCFSGPSDISPYDRAKMELLSGTVLNTPLYLNLANCRRFRKALFPPPASYLCELINRGFHDTKDFILSNDLIQCNNCYASMDLHLQPVFGKSGPTITPSVSPCPSRAPSVRRSRANEMRNNEVRKDERGFLVAEEAPQSFSRLLRDKLRDCSPPDSPTVVVTATNDGLESPADSGLDVESPQAGEPTFSLSSASSPDPGDQQPRGLFAKRRSTLAAIQEGPLQVIQDKFKLAPNPLPSCPPSPNLNRHCTECIRLRQEARADLIAEDVRLEVEKHRKTDTPPKTSGIKAKLKSPLRWFRQLGVKSSYEFQEVMGQ